MREPECILVRVGEQALKSKRTQRIWWKILLENIRAALQSKAVHFRLESSLNRIFVYTKQIKQAIDALRKVFGITSLSPCWTCHAGLDEIKLLATDIATDVIGLGPKRSFAVRARRAGRHKFSAREIEEEVGAAIKRVTNAKVNLNFPDFTIWIEVRSRRAYVFIEKIAGPGGLPLGTGGRVLALIDSKRSALAAWFIARRGARLCLLVRGKGKQYIDFLRNWHKGKKLEFVESLAQAKGIKAIVTSEKLPKDVENEIRAKKLLHLCPLVACTKQELESFYARAGL